MEQSGFVRGALLLTFAALLSKLLGSVYTIVLQNVIGDHGMGLFQMAYPVYATLLSIATAGFPVAISKLVSERVASGDDQGANRVLFVSTSVLTVAGFAAGLVLFVFADQFAQLAGDPAAVLAIRSIAPALLFVPAMSALRGYFQGYLKMEPTAKSQVIEQFIRVLTIIGLSVWLMSAGFGSAAAAAGAAFGAVTGALAGLLSVGADLARIRCRARRHKQNASGLSYGRLTKRLMYYALPISLGALVVPLMNNIDVLTVVNLLKGAGLSQKGATTAFGLMSGRGVKLMMLPTTLAAGIGVAVMPAVSEAFTRGHRASMRLRIDLAVRMTVLIALPASVGLLAIARSANVALFQTAAGTTTIQILAFAILFASVQTTLAAVLQGAGIVYLPVVHLGLACLLKLVLNIMLIPQMGITGAALSTVFSYGLAAVLNAAAVTRHLGADMIDWKWLLRPLAASLFLFSVVFAATRQFPHFYLSDIRSIAILFTLVAVAIGSLIYGLSLLLSGSIGERELASIPRFGHELVKWCAKLHLLKI